MNENRTLPRIFFGFLIISCLMLVFIVGVVVYSKLIINNPVIIAQNKSNDSVTNPPDSYDKNEETGISQQGNLSDEILISETDDLFDTESILRSTKVNENDLYLLAKKYSDKTDIPVMLKTPPIQYQNGDFRKFWVLNVDTNDYRQIDAKLVYQTPHIYFWVENGIKYSNTDIGRLADIFENQIYSHNRKVFGSEFSPGVDNDVHLAILYAKKLGGAAGYFSSADSFMPDIEKYSNKAEMFYLSADHVNLSNDYIYGVMAHEFQHMIHWFIDRDEAAWVNEGLSELAVDINNFDLGGFSYLFLFNPDLQLNFWPGNDQGNSAPHYGASYLFIKYLYDQYGEQFITSLVSRQENGFFGVDANLEEFSEYPNITAEDIFQNWTIANYLDNDVLENGIYGYSLDRLNAVIEPGAVIHCDDDSLTETVNQFGTDYFYLSCDSDYQIQISWNEDIPILPVDPHSGDFYYWSNRGDESAMRLSQNFDFSKVEGPIEFTYWVWYDIEEDYDYLYLNVFSEGKWISLQPTSCTEENPTGSNFGCGYNGKSEKWVRESVDLSAYAGKEITLEFEYITDAAVNGEGLVLDDMQIDAVEYFTDFEDEMHGWNADGFVRIKNEIPQYVATSLIKSDESVNISKEIFKTQANITFDVENTNKLNDEVILISGLSRFTHLPSTYTIEVNSIK